MPANYVSSLRKPIYCALGPSSILSLDTASARYYPSSRLKVKGVIRFEIAMRMYVPSKPGNCKKVSAYAVLHFLKQIRTL